MKAALLCIDLVNDCLASDGKLVDMGFAENAKEFDVMQRIARIQEHFREQGGLVLHTRTVFSKGYHEHPAKSPALGDVRKKGALILGEEGAEFYPETAPKNDEPILNKYRLGVFYRTRLEIILHTQGITDLYIVGLSTLGSVKLAADEAHDRDFNVCVIKDGCIDKSKDRHELGLKAIGEIAEVKPFKEIAVRLTMNAMENL